MAMFKRRITTSIEINERHLKLAQISSKGGQVKVVACVYKELSSSDLEGGAKALQQILREHNIRPRHVILSIPRHSVTIKNVKLPSKNLAELDEMAGFQAVKQIPYSKEEMAYGFNVIGADPEGYSKVMLVICHREVIERPIEILRSCGLSPEKVTLSSFGLLNWFNFNNELRKQSETSPVILVDCDTNSSDVAIIHMGKLVYTRGLTFGYAEGMSYHNRLADEIDKTLPTLEKESELARPTHAVFTGNVSESALLKSESEGALNMKIQFVDPFKLASLSIAPAFQPYVTQASYSSLIGTAIGEEEVDLLPKALKLEKSAKIKKRELTISVILTFAVITSISFTAWNKIHQKELILNNVESKLSQTAPFAQEIEKMRMATEVITYQLKKKSEALDVLNELHKIIPPQIYLILYTYDEEKAELKGTANALSDVFKLVTVLEDSPSFKNVEVRYATKRKIGEQELVDFEIVCHLNNGVAKKEK